MKYCDETEDVISWASEEIAIPYISPLDNRQHKYYVDFWVKVKESDGSIKCKLIEIKPKKQTSAPEKKAKKSKTYIKEVMTWVVNEQKWKEAKKFCDRQEWEFVILTEDDLF